MNTATDPCGSSATTEQSAGNGMSRGRPRSLTWTPASSWASWTTRQRMVRRVAVRPAASLGASRCGRLRSIRPRRSARPYRCGFRGWSFGGCVPSGQARQRHAHRGPPASDAAVHGQRGRGTDPAWARLDAVFSIEDPPKSSGPRGWSRNSSGSCSRPVPGRRSRGEGPHAVPGRTRRTAGNDPSLAHHLPMAEGNRSPHRDSATTAKVEANNTTIKHINGWIHQPGQLQAPILLRSAARTTA